MKNIFLILLLIPMLVFSQKKKKISKNKQAKMFARHNIGSLKDGVLLVRLSERKNSINAMRKAGKDKMADKTEHEQKERNKLIIAAFRANFTFSKVYFFYSDDSEFIRKHQLDSVKFINNDLEIDLSIKVNVANYYTAKYGNVDPDAHRKTTTTTFVGVGNVRKSSGITLTALIIMDDQLIQLAKPFPYYVREYKSLPYQRAMLKIVQKMNENLLEFYRKNN